MRSLLMIAFAGLPFVAEVRAAEPSQVTVDERAIRAVVARGAAAWEAGDGKGYAGVFAENADYVTFGGMHLRGRDSIAGLHQQLFDGPLAGSRLELEVESVRELRPEVVLVHVVGGIVEAGDARLGEDRKSMQVLVMTKDAATWQVASCQVTRIESYDGPPRSE